MTNRNEDIEDRVDRAIWLLGRRLDGRLDDPGARTLAELLASDPVAREVERDLEGIRTALRSEPQPVAPAGSVDRAIARALAARRQTIDRGRVLRLARILTAAAAIALVSSVAALEWGGRTNGEVGADPILRQPTIEDRLPRENDDGPPTWDSFLRHHFLGQGFLGQGDAEAAAREGGGSP